MIYPKINHNLPYNLNKRGSRTLWRQGVRHPGFPEKKIRTLWRQGNNFKNLKTKLKKFISNDQFTLNLGPGLEAAASNFYKSSQWPGLPNSLEKVYPVDKLEHLLIHHASNKHTKTNTEFLTFDQLLNIMPK